MAPARYTRDFFNSNAAFRLEWDEAVKDSVDIPVHLLPRMKLLQTVPWRTDAVTSGDTLIEWIQKHEKMDGFIPGMTGLSHVGVSSGSNVQEDEKGDLGLLRRLGRKLDRWATTGLLETTRLKYHTWVLTGISRVEPFNSLTLEKMAPRELNKTARFLWEYKIFDLLASYTSLPNRKPQREIYPNKAAIAPFRTKPGTSVLFTSCLNDWALAVDKFFALLDTVRPGNTSSSAQTTSSNPHRVLRLLPAPPTETLPPTATSTQNLRPESTSAEAQHSTTLSTANQSSASSSTSQAISPWNTQSAVDSWSTLILQEVESWTPDVVFDNEVKMFARCVKRESSQHIPAVCINFELAAWMFCTLTETETNEGLPSFEEYLESTKKRSKDKAQFLADLLGTDGLPFNKNQIHMPLILSLCVSPILLLSRSSTTYGQNISTSNIFMLSESLGNTGKPAIMQEFEAKIWEAVFQIAFGRDVWEALVDLKTYWIKIRPDVMIDTWSRNWWKTVGHVDNDREDDDSTNTDPSNNNPSETVSGKKKNTFSDLNNSPTDDEEEGEGSPAPPNERPGPANPTEQGAFITEEDEANVQGEADTTSSKKQDHPSSENALEVGTPGAVTSKDASTVETSCTVSSETGDPLSAPNDLQNPPDNSTVPPISSSKPTAPLPSKDAKPSASASSRKTTNTKSSTATGSGSLPKQKRTYTIGSWALWDDDANVDDDDDVFEFEDDAYDDDVTFLGDSQNGEASRMYREMDMKLRNGGFGSEDFKKTYESLASLISPETAGRGGKLGRGRGGSGRGGSGRAGGGVGGSTGRGGGAGGGNTAQTTIPDDGMGKGMRTRKQTDRYITQPDPTTNTRKSTKATASVEKVAPEGKKPRKTATSSGSGAARGKAALSSSGKGKGKAREQDISEEEPSPGELFRKQVSQFDARWQTAFEEQVEIQRISELEQKETSTNETVKNNFIFDVWDPASPEFERRNVDFRPTPNCANNEIELLTNIEMRMRDPTGLATIVPPDDVSEPLPLHLHPHASEIYIPYHHGEHNTSCIFRTTYSNFRKLGADTIRMIFEARHILITDCPLDEDFLWTPEFMEIFGPLDVKLPAQDLTKRDLPGEDQDQLIDEHKYSLRDALYSAPREWREGEARDIEKEWEINGKVLNFLDIPNPGHPIVQIPGVRALSGNDAAMKKYRYESGTHHALQPITDFSWNIVTCKNFTSRFHVDTAGLATASLILKGGKYWVVSRSQADTLAGNQWTRFRDALVHHEGTKIKPSERFEGVYLGEWTAFIMRPGTRHYVLTTGTSGVAGNHFYSASVVYTTCISAVQTLLADKIATNTEHSRVLHYIGHFGRTWLSHAKLIATDPKEAAINESRKRIPDLGTHHGFDEIMSIACHVVFPRSLDARTYSAGQDVPRDEQESRTNSQRMYVQLIHWLAAHGRLQWIPNSYHGQELRRMDDRISSLLPDMRYRAPVFYLLNFACSVFSMSLDLRRSISPVGVTSDTLSEYLIQETRDFLGPAIADVLTDLFLLTILEAQDEESTEFEGFWLTFDLDGYLWIPQMKFSCIRKPRRGAKGLLWTVEPEEWLMNSGYDDPGQELGEDEEDEEDEEDGNKEDEGKNDEDMEEEGEEETVTAEATQGHRAENGGGDGDVDMGVPEGDEDFGVGAKKRDVEEAGADTDTVEQERENSDKVSEEGLEVEKRTPRSRKGKGKVEVLVSRTTRSAARVQEESGAEAGDSSAGGSTAVKKKARFADHMEPSPQRGQGASKRARRGR